MTRASDAMRRVRAWAAGLGPWPILIAGWAVFLVYAYPGYMSSDSVDQLLDARLGTFNDWHSPTMTEVWRWVGFTIAGPFGMLALQSLLVLLGAYALAARSLPRCTAALVASGLLVFPPVMAGMAVLWQDSQMAGFLIAGLAAVTSRRRGAQVAGVGLLVLAAAMRVSAAFAVLPMLAIGWTWRVEVSSRRRYAVALVAWIAVWAAAIGLDIGLRSAPTDHAELDLAVTDLVGVLRYGPSIDDAKARKLLAGIALRGDKIQARARPFYTHAFDAAAGPDRVFDLPVDAEGRAALIAAQRRLARAFPGGYLSHRWHLFYRVLGVQAAARTLQVYVGFAGSDQQAEAAVHLAQHSVLQRAAIAVVEFTAQTPLFWPYVYLLAAIALLVVAVRRRQAIPAILLASGIGYELTWFVVASGARFAMSHWLITSTSLAGALLAIDAVRARRARRG